MSEKKGAGRNKEKNPKDPCRIRLKSEALI